jgi:VanZ family protein
METEPVLFSRPEIQTLNSSRKQVWKAWLPALIWIGVIVIESTKVGAASNTSRILYPVLHFLTGVDPVRFEVWHHYIRKTGHFVGYFTLSLLLFRAWRATLPHVGTPRWTAQWARVSLFMTVLIASLDEWHQSFLPSRTGRWQDVVLDSSAALVAQIIIWTSLRSRRGTTA